MGFAPAAECLGPLFGTVQIEDQLAGDDHLAVNGPGGEGRYLTGGGGDHRLIQQEHALDRLPHVHQSRPTTKKAIGDEVGIGEALGDLGDLLEDA